MDAVTKSKQDFQTVAVLAGGIGTERDVSLMSGQTVYRALQKTGLDVVFFDITPDDMSILDDDSIDIFFPILHGQFGEDGKLQAVLEERGLCFTGSGSASSRLAIDKAASKTAFTRAGVEVPKSYAVFDRSFEDKKLNGLPEEAMKYVVKPIRHGSSVGVQIADSRTEAIQAAKDCYSRYRECMIEAFISGREITVGVVDDRTLPIVEIRSQQAFYNYEAKYVSDATRYLFDTIEDSALIQRIQEQALACFQSLECRHWGRIDFIVADDAIPYVLEANTLPGFTSHSLIPMAAARAGISADQLCLKICEAAWRDRKPKTHSVET